MNLYQQKVHEVMQHITNGDDDLGYRRMIDCALDTNDTSVYNECIQLHEWKEANATNTLQVKERVLAFLQQLLTKNIPQQNTPTTLLEAKDVTKHYSKGNFTLGAINIHINSGDIIGLVGENGNGKTTLLRILANEITANSGAVHYQFTNTSQDNYSLRSQLIYIPQRTPTWYGLVKDNLKLTATHYGIKGADNEALVLMYMIRLGLWQYRNMRWSELSSGYKMRFELVRTFLRQQLILEDLKYMAKSLHNPIGIILSSQVLYEVEKISDEVIFLKKGKQDSFNRLKENNNTALNTIYIEFETDSSKELINQALQQLNLVQIRLNGGAYNVEANDCTANEILKKLIEANITIKYYRDITFSTRRLFN
jgi:ABC-2 type transport system ATP-binding protein